MVLEEILCILAPVPDEELLHAETNSSSAQSTVVAGNPIPLPLAPGTKSFRDRAIDEELKNVITRVTADVQKELRGHRAEETHLLSETSLRRVLTALLDDEPFFASQQGQQTSQRKSRYLFNLALSNVYRRLKTFEEDSADKKRNASLLSLRGAIGLICFMLGVLKRAETQGQALSASTETSPPLEDLLVLKQFLDDENVKNWFMRVYRPDSSDTIPFDVPATKSAPPTTIQGPIDSIRNLLSSIVPNRQDGVAHYPDPLADVQPAPVRIQESAELLAWKDLNPSSFRLHRVGTTSFILKCRKGSAPGVDLALKCLLFPYTKIASITKTTREYAGLYPAGEDYKSDLSPVVTVHSSTDKWILMNFVHGLTLQELLDQLRGSEGKFVPLLRTGLLRSISLPLFDAIEFLNTSPSLVQPRPHEDLTPSNIIVQLKENGEVAGLKLIDVGRNYLYTYRIGLAQSRDALFVAPEVRNDISAASTERMPSINTADLYSFGMILAELADPSGITGPLVPNSLYEYAPLLARLVEDLVDARPKYRLLLFDSASETSADQEKAVYARLRAALTDGLVALPVSYDTRRGIQFWARQIGNLQYPREQLAPLRALSDLEERSWYRPSTWFYWLRNFKYLWPPGEQASTRQRSRYLYQWVILCIYHYYVAGGFCLVMAAMDIEDSRVRYFLGIFGESKSLAVAQLLVDWGVYSPNVTANLPAHLTILSVMAQTLAYQNILAWLVIKPRNSTLAKWAEGSLRATAICSLPFVIACNTHWPQYWAFALFLGYIVACVNNYLCYALASRALRAAQHKKLSTVLPSDDHTMRVFGQMRHSMAIYMVLILGIGIGLATGKLHDEPLYVAGIAGVSIFIWCISRCTILAPAFRGRLHRALIVHERLGGS